MEIMTPALTSCQFVAGQILETSAGSPLEYLSIIPVLLLLKLLLSLSAQQLHLKDITHSVRRLPQKLSVLLITHAVPQHNLIVTKQPTLEAYVIGVLRPKIVLSEFLVRNLSKKQLEAVFLHELFHLRNKHPLVFLLSNACSSVCWFLPIIKELSELIQTKCEIAADQFAVSSQGTHAYLVSALRSCLTTTEVAQKRWRPAAVPMLQARMLEQRIEMLLRSSKPKNDSISVTTIFTSTIVVGSLVVLAALKPTLSVSAQAPNKCTFAECVSQCVTERLSGQRTFSPGLYSPADVE